MSAIPVAVIALGALLFSVSLAGVASAHPYSGIDARDPTQEFITATTDQWFQWDFHPSIFTGIVILTTLYTLGITVWRKKYNLAEEVDVTRAVIFYADMVLLWFLLDGPMHHLSDELLFSAHMVQHLGLQLVWAPLLILGTPGWLIRPLLQPAWVQKVGRFVSKPSTAFILFHGVAAIWHLPTMYNLALFSHPWHIVEHVMFMSVAVNFWWCVLSPVEEVPRATLGRQAAFLFGNMFGMKALGLIITMHNEVLYTYYELVPRVWGLSPIGDQRIGGLIMWVPSGLVLWIALGYVFVQWRRQATPEKGSTGVARLDGRSPTRQVALVES